MHLTELCSYAICTYAELLLIEIAYLQSGPAYSYAVKRIMQLSDMHLSGVHCNIICSNVKITTYVPFL